MEAKAKEPRRVRPWLTISTAERQLRSGLWEILRTLRCPSGWPVRELIAICSQVMDGQELAAYLAPGAEDAFRHFVRKLNTYFRYDAKQDTVAVSDKSPSTAAEECLVRYLVLRIQASDGCLEIGGETFKKYQSAVPNFVAKHLNDVYGGSVERFLKSHPVDFVVDGSGAVARLTGTLHERTIQRLAKEKSLVLFFADLLQKIGATEDQPCRVHTLKNYRQFMSSGDRRLLLREYHCSLDVFFLLNPGDFARTEEGLVFPRNRDPLYTQALFLKQQVRFQSNFGNSQEVSIVDLAPRVRHSSSPIARCLYGVHSVEEKLRVIAWRHPAIFHVDDEGKKLWLREHCPGWSFDRWYAVAELSAVVYFIDVLRYIDATSSSRAICFNYMVCAATAAPPNCKDYLKKAYPALEVIGLFRLYPGVFDLPSVNRVCLKTTEEGLSAEAAFDDAGIGSCPDSVEEQAVEYVAKLLKFVRELNVELLVICLETAPLDVRNYCMASVKGRLLSVIKNGRRAALSGQKVRFLRRCPRPRQRTICNVCY